MAFKQMRRSATPAPQLVQKCEQLKFFVYASDNVLLQNKGEKSFRWCFLGSLFLVMSKNRLKTPEQTVCLSKNDLIVTDDQEMAGIFNQQFSGVFVHDDGNVPIMGHILHDKYININDNIVFTPVHVSNVLRRLKASYAAGLDELPATVLKKLAQQYPFRFP